MQTNASLFSGPLVHRLSQILYACLEELGTTKAALYLSAGEEDVFHRVTSYGWPRLEPPPDRLPKGHPLRTLLEREPRGVLGKGLAEHPELAPFCRGSFNPRYCVTPLRRAGKTLGLLIQRDPNRGESFSLERHEPPTLAIGEALVQAMASFADPAPEARAPREATPPLDPIHVPAPPTAAMTRVQEPFQSASPGGAPAWAPSQAVPSSQAFPLLPEQETFFWEAGSLLCRMVPASAAALLISDERRPRPLLTYSRTPLGTEQRRQVAATFAGHFPRSLDLESRILCRCEEIEWELLPGEFRTVLPVLLEEQFGEEDLLVIFRLEDQPFTEHEQEFIRQVSRMLGFYLQEARLHERYHQSFLSVSHRILASADGHLPSIRSQSVITAELAQELARQLRLPSAEVEAVSISAILHDVGTLLLDRKILDKLILSPEDRVQVQTHPILASTFLKDFQFPFDVLRIIRHHHESWNGRGYPDGLAGEAIPMGSRIIHLVESYGVMVTGTAYRPPKSHAEALLELERLSGQQFDPALVPEFVALLERRAASGQPRPPRHAGVR